MDEETRTESSSRPATRRALGRGLDALLPPASRTALRDVETSHIEPNPNQPRQRFERKALEDLADSIREHGLVQPLIVTQLTGERYRLIVGERRWQAAKLAGLERVPVMVKEATDRQTLELALVENVHRADLNALEEAAAYQRLIQDFGLTQQQVAHQVGKSRVAVTNTLRLMALPDTLKRALLEERITEGHARALLALSDERSQLTVLQRVEREELNVRQTEELVQRLLQPAGRGGPSKAASPDIQAIEDELRRALGTKVSLRPRKKGGRIVIEYYSEDDFHGLYERLVGPR